MASSSTNNRDKLRFYAKTGPTVLILVAVLTGTFICIYSPRFVCKFSVRAWNKITRHWCTHLDARCKMFAQLSGVS